MFHIILATAELAEDGAGGIMRTHILSLPLIPASLIHEFSFHFSAWAFLQIPIIVALVFFSSHWMRRTQATLPTRVTAPAFVYMAATLTTNILLGALMK